MPTQSPPPQAPSKPKSFYLLAAWRGEFGLGFAFIAHVLVLGAVPVWLIYRVLGPTTQGDTQQAMLAPLILWPAVGLILTWQLVGTYHSAQKALRSGSSLAILVIGLLFAIGCGALVFFGMFGASQVGLSLHAFTGSPELPPSSITVLGNGTVVEFDGGIRMGSAKQLEEVLAGTPRAGTLYIHSPGGLYTEARAMEAIVRRHQLNTFASKDCSGAASFVFLAGSDRFVTSDAQFSFKSDLQPLTKRLIHGDPLERRLNELGVDPQFTLQACFYPRDQPYVADAKDMVEAKFATMRVDPLHYPLDAVDLAALNETWLRDRVFEDGFNQAYADGDPEGFSAYLKEGVQKLREGHTMGEVVADLNARVKAAEKAVAGHPSYAAIDTTIDWAIQLLTYNKDYTPAPALQCFFIGPSLIHWDHDYIVHHLAHYPFDKEKEVWEELLRYPHDPAGPAVSSAREKIMEIAHHNCDGDADWTQLKRGIPVGPYDQREVAGIWAQTLVEIRAKPEEERWPLEAYLVVGYRH